MNIEKKLFTVFLSPFNFYIYDANSNNIAKISKQLYYNLLDNSNEETTEITNELAELNASGVLIDSKLETVEDPISDDMLIYYLSNKLSMLSLQLTQQCNFRCSYCKYTKAVDNRAHANKEMKLQTALNAIEFFSKRVSDSENVNIGFYGGEPLLKFDLIYKCIEYSKPLFMGKPLSFSITTNGSLLTEEIMEYFYQNNVHVLVSLDGPQEINDYNRKYSSNGAGTFGEVFANLNALLTSQRYKKNIRVNAVISPSYDYMKYENFFRNKLFSGVKIYAPFVELENNRLPVFSKDFALSFEYSNYLTMRQIAEDKPEDYSFSISSSYHDYYNSVIKVLEHHYPLPSIRNHSGPCLPGKKRLFVNTDGRFLPCEKVSELNELNFIGSLEKGFDFKSVRNVLNSTSSIKNECKHCWAIRFCDVCAKICNDSTKESITNLRKHCNSLRQATKNMLLDYVAIQEMMRTN